MDELIRVKACVLGDGDRKLSEGLGVGLDGQGLFALDSFSELFASDGH